MTLITITIVHASEHHQVAEKLMALLDRQSTGRVELREFEKVTDSQSSTEAAAAITVATTNAITKKAPSSPPQPPLLLITHPFPVFLVLLFFRSSSFSRCLVTWSTSRRRRRRWRQRLTPQPMSGTSWLTRWEGRGTASPTEFRY